MDNLDQLLEERKRLDQKIKDVQQAERAGALVQARDLVSKFEFTAKELGISGARKTSGRSTVAAKYRNPATGDTWTGRGKSPRWIREAEASGKSRESFLIV